MSILFYTCTVTPDIVHCCPSSDVPTNRFLARALCSGSSGARLSDTRNHIQTSNGIWEHQNARSRGERLYVLLLHRKMEENSSVRLSAGWLDGSRVTGSFCGSFSLPFPFPEVWKSFRRLPFQWLANRAVSHKRSIWRKSNSLNYKTLFNIQ